MRLMIQRGNTQQGVYIIDRQLVPFAAAAVAATTQSDAVVAYRSTVAASQ